VILVPFWLLAASSNIATEARGTWLRRLSGYVGPAHRGSWCRPSSWLPSGPTNLGLLDLLPSC